MKSTIFNSIKVTAPQSNTFDLSHDVKMSGRMGNLMPCLALECIPGDKIDLACDTFTRFAPMIAPIMHRVNVYMHYFFVPNRILWDGWEDYIVDAPGAGALPQLTMNNTWTAAQLAFADYLGVPPWDAGTSTTPVDINALPFAAYQKIYSDWYRDQNLIAEPNWALTAGSNQGNLADLATMRRRAWEHDYFTAALPFAQKGTAVGLPLGEIVVNPDWAADGNQPYFVNSTLNKNAHSAYTGNGTNIIATLAIGPPPSDAVAYDPDGALINTNTTINDLRRAYALQKWFEKNARAGTRYVENILVNFGVRSSDQRLQRAEYITGTKSPVVVSEVLNTTGESAGLPQGNMAGHAVSVGNGYGRSYFAEEHGYIIGIMSVMPLPAYQQGIPKNFLKTDPFDFFWPDFAHIGEQEILNNELYAYQATGTGTFGYIPRYAEYKYMPNRVAGEFRTTLNFWHLGRIFASLPTLSQTFIEVDEAEQDRIFAVSGDDNLYIQILHNIKARRKMPVFGTPML